MVSASPVKRSRTTAPSTTYENLAEEKGFEPLVAFTTTVFKTVAFDHSATPPRVRRPCATFFCACQSHFRRHLSWCPNSHAPIRQHTRPPTFPITSTPELVPLRRTSSAKWTNWFWTPNIFVSDELDAFVLDANLKFSGTYSANPCRMHSRG